MINWSTKQGKQTNSNNDYCYIHDSNGVMMSIVIDVIALKKTLPIDYELTSRTFALVIFKEIHYQLSIGKIDIPAFVQNIRNAVLSMRQFAIYRCCYSLVILDKNMGIAHLISLGDCLISFNPPLNKIQNQIFQPHHLSESPNHVYKCFSVRKLHEPEYKMMQLNFKKLYIATDGYWLNDETDDASCLELDIEQFINQHTCSGSHITSNLYYI